MNFSITCMSSQKVLSCCINCIELSNFTHWHDFFSSVELPLILCVFVIWIHHLVLSYSRIEEKLFNLWCVVETQVQFLCKPCSLYCPLAWKLHCLGQDTNWPIVEIYWMLVLWGGSCCLYRVAPFCYILIVLLLERSWQALIILKLVNSGELRLQTTKCWQTILFWSQQQYAKGKALINI